MVSKRPLSPKFPLLVFWHVVVTSPSCCNNVYNQHLLPQCTLLLYDPLVSFDLVHHESPSYHSISYHVNPKTRYFALWQSKFVILVIPIMRDSEPPQEGHFQITWHSLPAGNSACGHPKP